MDYFDQEEARRVAEQIHSQWPFISVLEAHTFYVGLGHINAAEGAVRVSLWVLGKVLQQKTQV